MLSRFGHHHATDDVAEPLLVRYGNSGDTWRADDGCRLAVDGLASTDTTTVGCAIVGIGSCLSLVGGSLVNSRLTVVGIGSVLLRLLGCGFHSGLALACLVSSRHEADELGSKWLVCLDGAGKGVPSCYVRASDASEDGYTGCSKHELWQLFLIFIIDMGSVDIVCCRVSFLIVQLVEEGFPASVTDALGRSCCAKTLDTGCSPETARSIGAFFRLIDFGRRESVHVKRALRLEGACRRKDGSLRWHRNQNRHIDGSWRAGISLDGFRFSIGRLISRFTASSIVGVACSIVVLATASMSTQEGWDVQATGQATSGSRGRRIGEAVLSGGVCVFAIGYPI